MDRIKRISFANRMSAEKAICPVAADVSRRILADHAGLIGHPQHAWTAIVRAAAPGPPTYVGGYELVSPCFGASPPRFLLPADDFIIHHGYDFTPVRENQKTYRRLFGMIFFGWLEPLLIAYLQRLIMQKTAKNRKNSKANSFLISRNIDLAAKTPQKRPVFSVSTNS
ncbi:MAG TPA: hypothetical protein VGR14_07325 [Verrucomicrobiae bacterium]|jgi:hypothetical protein|nr:hypothetical protein [Verrucomicrobiae bacterium]